jgi:hypothetical protein
VNSKGSASNISLAPITLSGVTVNEGGGICVHCAELGRKGELCTVLGFGSILVLLTKEGDM